MRSCSEAIANNPDLRVAAARVEQAAQYLVVAEAALRPSIGIFGTGGAKTGGGGDAPSALQALAAASWELDLWGRVRYARNAAQQVVRIRAGGLRVRAPVAGGVHGQGLVHRDAVDAAGRNCSARWFDPRTSCSRWPRDRERVGVGTDAETASPARPRAISRARLQQARVRTRSGVARAGAAGRPLSRRRESSARADCSRCRSP